MASWIPEHDALAEDLRRVVDTRLLDPVELLFGLDDPLPAKADLAIQSWTAELLGEDDEVARFTAIRLVSVLYPGDAPFDPPTGWWGTPFGRAVLLRAGHPTADAVPYSAAAAMLGITRQGVHDLAQRGKLARHPDGGVTVESVRARIRTRTAADFPAR